MNVQAITDTESAVKILSTLNEKDTLMLEYYGLKSAQCETTVKHHIHNGIYTREYHVPKGAFVIGKMHKSDVMNIIAKGSATVSDENGNVVTVSAPYCFVSGKKKIGYFHEDSVWINVEKTDKETIEEIEDDLYVESDYSKIEDHIDYIEAINEIGFTHSEVLSISQNMDDAIYIDDVFGLEIKESDINGDGVFTITPRSSSSAIAPVNICGFRTVYGRKINHSKNPNCIFQWLDDQSVHVVSVKDIALGEEITVDYRQAFKTMKEKL